MPDDLYETADDELEEGYENEDTVEDIDVPDEAEDAADTEEVAEVQPVLDLEDAEEEPVVAKKEDKPAYARPTWTPNSGLTEAEHEAALNLGMDPDQAAFMAQVNRRQLQELRQAEVETHKARSAAGISSTLADAYNIGRNGFSPEVTMTPEGALTELLSQVGADWLANGPEVAVKRLLEAALPEAAKPAPVAKAKAGPVTKAAMPAAARTAPKATTGGGGAPRKAIDATDLAFGYLTLDGDGKRLLKKVG